jgi:hypothetical protein
MTMESILSNRHPIGVTFTDDDVIVTLSDGTKVSNPLSWHWWLEQATPEQRANVEFYSDSIDWPDLDEGLDVEGMLRGIKPRQPRPITK